MTDPKDMSIEELVAQIAQLAEDMVTKAETDDDDDWDWASQNPDRDYEVN